MRFYRFGLVAAAMGVALSGCAALSGGDAPVADAIAPPARIDLLDRTSRDALERGIASGRLQENKYIYSVVLADDAARFDSGRFSLSPQVRRQLTGLVKQLRTESRNIYLEIQGHTDSVGSVERNRQLGLKRAEAVRRFLRAQGLAPERMATISYGEDAPVAPNLDPLGRAENRRVVIVVLS